VRDVFAAAIFHADTAEMLHRCIEHHLTVGVDRIFVSLNEDDPESAAVAAAFESPGVRVARLDEFAADRFDYFTAALNAVAAWARPDWLMFVDSDEFWVPAGGTMHAVAGLEYAGGCAVRRFNAPPLRAADGALRAFGVANLAAIPVIAERQAMDAELLARGTAPWIAAKVGPKQMLRPRLARRVKYGAHEFVPAYDGVRVIVPDDLLIVHVPFTDEARFRRKVELVGAMLAAHADRFHPGEAWHWRYWRRVAERDGLAAEFAEQVVDERDLAGLRARGVLTTPAELFGTRRLVDA
jgi:Glycosyl transferase family 2